MALSATPDQIIEELLAQKDEPSRQALLGRPELAARLGELVNSLAAKVDFFCRSEPAQAPLYAELALLTANQSGEPALQGLARRAEGHSLRAIGQHQEALVYYQQAVVFFKKAGLPSEEGRTYLGEIAALSALGDFNLCLKRGASVQRRLTRLDDKLNLAKLAGNMSVVYFRMGRYRSALRLHNQAITLFKGLELDDMIPLSLLNRALTLEKINRFQQAALDYQTGRAYFSEKGMTALVAQIDSNIGYLKSRQGRFNEAVELLNSARDIFEVTAQPDKRAVAEMDLAYCYSALGLYDEALASYEQAIPTFTELAMKYERLVAEIGRVEVLIKKGGLDQANQNLGQLLQFIQTDPDFAKHTHALALVLYLKAQLLSQLDPPGNLSAALAACTQARELFHSLNLSDFYAQSLILEADLLQRGQKWLEAEDLYHLAHPILERLKMPRLWYQYYYGMGRLKQAQLATLDPQARRETAYEAHQELLRAVEQVESVRASLQPEEWRSAFMASGLGAYESLVNLCLRDTGNPARLEEAFGYIERAKSRSLLDLLSQNLTPVRTDSNEEMTALAERIEQFRAELNWYYSRLHNQQAFNTDDESQRLLRLEFEQMSHKIEIQERKLADLWRRYRSRQQATNNLPALISEPKEDLLGELKLYLAAGSNLLEYYVLDNKILAFVLNQNGIQHFYELGALSQVIDLQERLNFQANKFNLGQAYVERHMPTLKQSFDNYLKELYQLLLAPLRTKLSGNQLIIVPHANLHTLPFHALHDGEAYLGQHFDISYAPSTAVLLHCLKQPKRPIKKLLALAVPDEQLPGVENEVRSLSGYFAEARLLVGPEASLEGLQANLDWCDALHLASHGIFRQDNPLFSTIKLADGWLAVHDVMNWRFRPALVTLSACQTGLQRPMLGDELLGLARGFLSSGAYSLLVSLWSVSDEVTTYLMQYFYEALTKGYSRASALRRAILKLKSNEKYSHPHYWAPFILIGQP